MKNEHSHLGIQMDNKPSNNCCKEMTKMHMVLWCKRFNSLIYKVVCRRLACGSCIIRLCAVCFEFNASGRMCTPHFQWSKSSDGMILQPSTFDAHLYPKQKKMQISLFFPLVVFSSRTRVHKSENGRMDLTFPTRTWKLWHQNLGVRWFQNEKGF